jgi:DNA-directed RNA polymerase specialized sigma24 family protein
MARGQCRGCILARRGRALRGLGGAPRGRGREERDAMQDSPLGIYVEDERLGAILDKIIKSAAYDLLKRAVESLDRREMEMIRLYYFEGIKIKDIASRLKIDYNTSKVYFFNIKMKLRRILIIKGEMELSERGQ